MQPIPSRRKLLRGSLAAPLVLTVASPSALAVSSFQQCIAKGANSTPPDPLISMEDPVWLRTQVKLYECQLATGSPQTYYLSPLDSLYYPVDGSSCGIDILQFKRAPTLLSDVRYALVYVDEEGTPVGLGACPNNGMAVSTSCWASVQGTPA